MYEVKVRDIPARSLLCLLRHASNEQAVWDLGKEVIGMLKARPTPRLEGVAGAAFLIYYGEVNQDSDGPVEFCWPVPQDLASELAAGFPALTLRTEPAHQEACISGQDARGQRSRNSSTIRSRPGPPSTSGSPVTCHSALPS